MAIPSTCPDCGSLLDHSKPSPGGEGVTMEVSCPDCEYEDTV